LLHISELADHKISRPQDVVKEGDEIEVKILKVDTEARKIGLSLRRAQWAAEDQGSMQSQQKAPEASPAILSDFDVGKPEEPQEKTSEEKQEEQSKPEGIE